MNRKNNPSPAPLEGHPFSRRSRRLGRALSLALSLVVLVALSWGCANMGNPEGGPYDMTPPRFIGGTPDNRATSVSTTSLRLRFDEFIRLLNQQEKLIISPAQHQPPRISAHGKVIDIRLEDSLRPHTTYSFYFADAVVDNNEDNPLEDFDYTFSTGESLDSMRLGGVVLDARTLEPVGGLVMGVYYKDEVSDSVFRTSPFVFVGKTSRMGRFSIRGLRDSVYRVFALKDDDNNYRYSMQTEGLAFDGVDWSTSLLDSLRTDTIRIDSIVRRDTIRRDSLITKPHTYYYPDSVLLRYFVAQDMRRGLQKHSRADSLLCRLEFVQEQDKAPLLRSLERPEVEADELYVASVQGRVVDYWLKDGGLISADSIRFALTYAKTDSLLRLSEQTDTLTFYKPREKASAKTKVEPQPRPKLTLKLETLGGVFSATPKDRLYLVASAPLAPPGEGAIILEASRDTLYKSIPYRFEQDSLERLRYEIVFERSYGHSYRVRIDSAALSSIYGSVNDSTGLQMRLSRESELGHLSMEVVGLEGRVMLELLDKSGEVLAQQLALDSTAAPGGAASGMVADSVSASYTPLKNGAAPDSTGAEASLPVLQTEFRDLKPGEYYLRLYIDRNGDGVWTTGSYPDRQPEEVYYCSELLSVKKGFTTAERWEPLAKPLHQQKPEALRKTKPEKVRERVDKNVEYYRRMEAKAKK